MEIKTRKPEKRLRLQVCRLDDISSISFSVFIGIDIETRKLERKSKLFQFLFLFDMLFKLSRLNDIYVFFFFLN